MTHSGGVTMDSINEDWLRFVNTSPVRFACAHESCDWELEAPLLEGRREYARHRRDRHPDSVVRTPTRECDRHGCTALTRSRGRLCPKHRKEADANTRARRPRSGRPTMTPSIPSYSGAYSGYNHAGGDW